MSGEKVMSLIRNTFSSFIVYDHFSAEDCVFWGRWANIYVLAPLANML
jgi:hypothetical protein